MATTASTRGFRTRAIAIAAVGSVALGGLAVVTPTGSVVAAPAAHAQETGTEKPGVQTSDVKYLGIFDEKGKVGGPFESSKYNKANNSNGRVIDQHGGYQIRAEFSLANANPGDVLRLSPHTEFTLPNGDPVKTSHGGMRITQTLAPTDVVHDGAVIGQFRTGRSGSMEITFSDAISEVKSGTVTLAAPVQVWDFYVSPGKNGLTDEEAWDGKGFSNSVEATSNAIAHAHPKGGSLQTAQAAPIGTVRFNTITSRSTKNSNRAYESNALIVDSENFTVRRTATTLELPAGANGVLTAEPNVDGEKHADWYLADDIVFVPTVRVFGEKGTDEEYEHENMSYEDAQAKFPGLKIEAKKTGRGITITTSGVPENVKPRVFVRPGASGSVGHATYLEGGSLYYKGEFNGTIDGVQEKRTLSNTVGSMTAIPGQPSISGLENVKRTGDLSGSIAGKPTGLGTDGSVAPVGGTKQTFQFFVKNTGDALLAAPIVTLPNGKKLPIKNVAIKPNGTGSFTVDYDVPKGNGALNFDVSLGKAELSPSSTVSFRYSQSSQADSVPDSFGYPTDKPVTVEQDHTVKSPKPKDAPKDTKYRIDRTANPNLPWASVDPNTGVVTLSPKADVVPGNYEVPVEATFPDGSKRTITLPVLVTGENPSDRMKEAEEAAKQAQDAANNAQETANQALKDLATERERVNDLTDRVNKAEKGLKDARERVGALEKENKAQQKEIDQAKKDVKDLQDKTKKLRAELDDAKKRVATLEEQNKKQQAQIDKLARENKKQQGEIDALKKENAKQQKLIEGLRKDLTAAEKRISTLETELAQTRLELAAVSERLGVVEDRLNTGLGKCVGTIGGSLAALVPAVLLASQFAGGSHMAQVDTSISNFQRQLGMFNPEVAKFVDQNRGAIAAGFAGLGILALLFVPGTCGDDSLGGAIAEPLSSAIDKRKAERENGEGTTAGSSLKIGDGADAGSSNKDKEDAA